MNRHGRIVAAVSLAAAFLTANCAGPRQWIWFSRSPEKTAEVAVMRIRRVEAPAGFVYESYAAHVGVDQPRREMGSQDLIWRSDGVPPLYIFWLSETELEVIVAADADALPTIEEIDRGGFRVTTRIVSSTKLSEVAPASSGTAPGE